MKLTLDLTVVRDFLDPSRARHGLAKQIFELAKSGTVELAIASQGHRLDVNRGDLVGHLQGLFRESVEETRQLAYPSEVTFPSRNLFPGQYVDGFDQAWNEVIASWRTHEGKPPGLADRFHVESHILEGRDVFLTDDGPLLVMCSRLNEEHGFSIRAMHLTEYIADASGSSS
jgi:hypothetical protein